MLAKLPIRGQDVHGSGAFGAPRGDHTHNGIDLACCKGTKVLSIGSGRVTKIGYPYNPTDAKKGHLRYVEVTDGLGLRHRYMYIKAFVHKGDLVMAEDVLGETQGLTEIYPGITDHYHYEVKLESGDFINPEQFL